MMYLRHIEFDPRELYTLKIKIEAIRAIPELAAYRLDNKYYLDKTYYQLLTREK